MELLTQSLFIPSPSTKTFFKGYITTSIHSNHLFLFFPQTSFVCLHCSRRGSSSSPTVSLVSSCLSLPGERPLAVARAIFTLGLSEMTVCDRDTRGCCVDKAECRRHRQIRLSKPSAGLREYSRRIIHKVIPARDDERRLGATRRGGRTERNAPHATVIVISHSSPPNRCAQRRFTPIDQSSHE